MALPEVSKAAAALKNWMDVNDVSQGELARRVTEKLADAPGRSDGPAVNQSTISSWCRGAYTPSGLAMVALQEITRRHVLVTDWLIPAPAESRRGSANKPAA